MTPEEQRMLESALSQSSFFLEFGCGGSTQLARTVSKGRVVSVETDPVWIQNVLKSVQLQANDMLLHADIGPVIEYGHPKNLLAQAHLISNYWSVFNKIGPESSPDVVLVDGRFRVATCLRVAERFPTARLFIHDFTIRLEYKILLEFFVIVKEVHTLVELRIRDTIDGSKMKKCIRQYSVDSR